jgi:putative membrane protein
MNEQQFPVPFPRGGEGVLVQRAGDAGGWPDGLSWVIFAVLLALLLLAIVSLALSAYWRTQGGGERVRSDALAELDLRYARGEIGRDEYLQRRVDLGGTLVAAPPSEATTAVGPPQPQT